MPTNFYNKILVLIYALLAIIVLLGALLIMTQMGAL